MYKILAAHRINNSIMVQTDKPEEFLVQEFLPILPYMLLHHAVLTPVEGPVTVSDTQFEGNLYNVAWEEAIISNEAQTLHGAYSAKYLQAAAARTFMTAPRLLLKDLPQALRSQIMQNMTEETKATVKDVEVVQHKNGQIHIKIILKEAYHVHDTTGKFRHVEGSDNHTLYLDAASVYETMNLLSYCELRLFPDMVELKDRYDLVFLTPSAIDHMHDLGSRINNRLTEIRRSYGDLLHTLVAIPRKENGEFTTSLTLLAVFSDGGGTIEMEINHHQIKYMAQHNLLLEPELKTDEDGRRSMNVYKTFDQEFGKLIAPWGHNTLDQRSLIENVFDLPGNPYDAMPKERAVLTDVATGLVVGDEDNLSETED